MKDTFRENWPDKLLALAFRSRALSLLPNELAFVGQWQPFYRQKYGLPYTESCPSLEEKISCALLDLGDSVFVRTGYCSWKRSVPVGFVSRSLADVMSIVRQSDTRVERGLLYARENSLSVFLHLIEWYDFGSLFEFRVFVKEGQVVGISAYNETAELICDVKCMEALAGSVLAFAKKVTAVLHLSTVVFDVAFDVDSTFGRLIELNPFSNLTNPCYFSWDSEFDASFRCSSGVWNLWEL